MNNDKIIKNMDNMLKAMSENERSAYFKSLGLKFEPVKKRREVQITAKDLYKIRGIKTEVARGKGRKGTSCVTRKKTFKKEVEGNGDV